MRLNDKIAYYDSLGIYDYDQLRVIFQGLRQRLDVDKYANPNLNNYQMEVIMFGLWHGVDVTKFNSEIYNFKHMLLIKDALSMGIDDCMLYNPKADLNDLRKIVDARVDTVFKCTEENVKLVNKDLRRFNPERKLIGRMTLSNYKASQIYSTMCNLHAMSCFESDVTLNAFIVVYWSTRL